MGLGMLGHKSRESIVKKKYGCLDDGVVWRHI